MPIQLELTDQRFGKLLAIKKSFKKSGLIYWECLCDCGKTHFVRSSLLVNGKVKSCGCLKFEANKGKYYARTHNQSNSKLYTKWKEMKGRCLNEKDKGYKNYGRRGITVCNDWLEFENFYNDMNTSYQEHCRINGTWKTTLDRIDVDGNYNKDNCRWADWKGQANNRRNNHYITYQNETLTLKQWSEKFNIHYPTLKNRITNLKWEPEKAFTTPVN
jgi:hypothetical protein